MQRNVYTKKINISSEIAVKKLLLLTERPFVEGAKHQVTENSKQIVCLDHASILIDLTNFSSKCVLRFD